MADLACRPPRPFRHTPHTFRGPTGSSTEGRGELETLVTHALARLGGYRVAGTVGVIRGEWAVEVASEGPATPSHGPNPRAEHQV